MRLSPNSTFARVIEDHLELKRRNATLDGNMPLDRYQVDDPFENHPLFKTEEQARLEESLGGVEPDLEENLVLAWPVAETKPEDTLWGRSRDFDRGD